MERQITPRMKPSYIQLYPTLRCTQSCAFCFNGRMASHGGDMIYDNALRLIDTALEHGISSIDIMGGEPFLLEWMPQFISIALDRGMGVNVSTNGSLPDTLRELRGLSGQALQVGISIEGASPATHAALTGSDNFHLALESIRTLQSIGFKPIAKTVVNRRNITELDGIAELLKHLGVRRYYLIHMDALGPDKGCLTYSYTEFIEIHQGLSASCKDIAIGKVHASCFDREGLGGMLRCAGGTRKLLVMPDGSVYPCNLLVSVEGFKMGNIFHDPYDTIINSKALWPLKEFNPGNHCVLSDCGNHQNCTGGCPAHIYSYGLSINSTDPRCMNWNTLDPGYKTVQELEPGKISTRL